MAKDKKPENEELKASIGGGFLRRQFGGKSFRHVLIELVKNARDWGAQNICIITEDKACLEMRDDGEGMSAKNRNAFASINMTTADGRRQAGKFCTGTKQMLFSFAVEVEVVTAPRETPDAVYCFSFRTDEYEAIVFSGGTIPTQRLSKTKETWPYEHPFGTRIRYKFQDPKSRSIKRGSDLAVELAARLPMKFADVVKIDGMPLPRKELIGRVFVESSNTAALGECTFEIYRPKQPKLEERLHFTGHEVGEVGVDQFLALLRDPELRAQVPAVFQHREVSGTVSARFLSEHANEDRATFRPSLLDDTRLALFLRLLRSLAPRIERLLELDLQTRDTAEYDIGPIAKALQDLYDPERKRTRGPVVTVEENEEETGSDPSSSPSRKPPALRLKVGHEFEPGERIVCEISMRDDIAQLHKPEDVQWHDSSSRARFGKRELDGTYSMVAHEIGAGQIRAEIPGTVLSVQASYEIVPRRGFRLIHDELTVRVGQTVMILATNLDKLRGKPVWRKQLSLGEMKAEGGKCLFTATRVGREVISASDSDNPSLIATCTVNIIGREEEEQLIPIRNDLFRVTRVQIKDSDVYGPVTIVGNRDSANPNQVFELIINAQAPTLRVARSKGYERVFMAQALAHAYARFFHAQQSEGTLDARDITVLLDEVSKTTYEVLEEIQAALL